ncbi:response regulator [Niveispirillum sp. KHB5.9]|uniref:response regulator n=1 Tax=Niveispirillum sp. KHB5.9 TaxID=3400269 RepID=UPI003A84E581
MTESPATPTPLRIMIVEDDALVALGVRLTVSELGYDVVGIAASEHEALALAQVERPQLALMDIRLRGTSDGVKVAQRLWQELRVRCIFLSAYADEHTMERVAQTRPLGFVQKPYSALQLKGALEQARLRLNEIEKPLSP